MTLECLSLSLLHVTDDNDDPNLILQQIFIVIAFVFHPLFYLSGVPFLTMLKETRKNKVSIKAMSDHISIHSTCQFQSTNK